MTALSGGTHFLVLSKSTDHSTSIVRAYDRFDDAHSRWIAGDRISPIFAIGGANPPPLSNDTVSWLFFLGPKYPGDVDFSKFSRAYLSLGLYNIVLHCTTDAERSAARDTLGDSGCWEEWEIRSNTINNISFGPGCHNLASSPTELRPKLNVRSDESTPAEREYRTLISQAVSVAMTFCPPIADQLLTFDKGFRKCLEDPSVDDLHRHGELVTVNAALSRYVSQTFAGTSPILEKNCHYLIHSLLGIGTASEALRRLESYVSEVFGAAGIVERLEHLRATTRPPEKPFTQLPSNDPFWKHDLLHDFHSGFSPDADDSVVPVLTCFSGRDGFRCTALSLSVPLEVLNGCNTVQWTLQTLTHETSHRLIEAVLALLLPNPEDPESITDAISLLRNPKNECSLFDEARRLLCIGVLQISLADPSPSQLSPRLLGDSVVGSWREVNETLTHVFDYLYHYRSDSTAYTESLWTSWAVIPNIEHRLPEYVLRTICALYANHIKRSKSMDKAIEDAQTSLRTVSEKLPSSPFIKRALEELMANKPKYKKLLAERAPLVKFVRFFLFSPKIAASVTAEPMPAGRGQVYSFRNGDITAERIGNPLSFIEQFASDRKSETLRAVWMLQMLAFRRS